MSSLSVPLAEKGKQLLTAVHQEPKNIKQLHVLPLLGIHHTRTYIGFGSGFRNMPMFESGPESSKSLPI